MNATADVCLLLEGTYPYVAGGVSSWTHDLIRRHPETTFHLLTLMPPDAESEERYEVPDNVVGRDVVTLQRVKRGRRVRRKDLKLITQLGGPLLSLVNGGGLPAFDQVNRLIAPAREYLGSEALLESRAAWKLLIDMYERSFGGSSFLDYFWSWRALLGGLYSVLLGPMPQARVYHTVSTGYAGLYAARAWLETGRPTLITEHGIYTNERRIEIAMADWLYELPLVGLSVERSGLDLKDMWAMAFEGYSLACYQASREIITLYEGNQSFQLADGAEPVKLRIIPNGVDVARYSAIKREDDDRPPQIALIGRVVPIKDVKTYIRACARVKEKIPDVIAYMMGPTEEDEDYFEDCRTLVKHLDLEKTVIFTGRVKLDDYLGKIDVIVLTSISEAQPLVLLEAGAAGVAAVATDVGSCSEMLLGRSDEVPPLGVGGAITMLADPPATANAVIRLLLDKDWHASCVKALGERVRQYYHEDDVSRIYGELYDECAAAETLPLEARLPLAPPSPRLAEAAQAAEVAE